MKCAACQKEFRGIEGLMPRRVPSQGRDGQHYEMVCHECMKEGQRVRDDYERASRGE